MSDTIIELALLAIVSFVSFVFLSLAAIVALPSNFFQETDNATATQNKYAYVTRLPMGLLVLTGGVVMLVTPGPGILFCLAGLALLKNKHPKSVIVHLVKNYNLVGKFNRVRLFLKRKPFTLHKDARSNMPPE